MLISYQENLVFELAKPGSILPGVGPWLSLVGWRIQRLGLTAVLKTRE